MRIEVTRASRLGGIMLGLLALAGCRQDMADQPRYGPLAPSNFFADGRSARPQVPGTVARGQLRDDELDRKSTRLNSSHIQKSRMPSSA